MTLREEIIKFENECVEKLLETGKFKNTMEVCRQYIIWENEIKMEYGSNMYMFPLFREIKSKMKRKYDVTIGKENEVNNE